MGYSTSTCRLRHKALSALSLYCLNLVLFMEIPLHRASLAFPVCFWSVILKWVDFAAPLPEGSLGIPRDFVGRCYCFLVSRGQCCTPTTHRTDPQQGCTQPNDNSAEVKKPCFRWMDDIYLKLKNKATSKLSGSAVKFKQIWERERAGCRCI